MCDIDFEQPPASRRSRAGSWHKKISGNFLDNESMASRLRAIAGGKSHALAAGGLWKRAFTQSSSVAVGHRHSANNNGGTAVWYIAIACIVKKSLIL
jgi:hypothetical protein